MTQTNIRIPMFWKFLVGCLLLASLLIFGGYLVVKQKAAFASRGKYLEKHFRRYLDGQEWLGQAYAGLANREAHDPRYEKLLTLPPLPPPTASDTALDAWRQTRDQAHAQAAEIAADAYETMGENGGLQPDMYLIFDNNGKYIWSSPKSVVKPDEVRTLPAVAALINRGDEFHNIVLLHGGEAMQIAGRIIYSNKRKLHRVGGIILGVRLHKYMEQYRLQSDIKKKDHMRHRLTVVDNQGNVVESVFPKATWDALGVALQPGNTDRERVGNDVQQVIHLHTDDGDDWDYSVKPVMGFDGASRSTVGQMFLMRNRANLSGRGPKFPTMEIVIGIGLSILVAWLLALWITRPIKRFVAETRRILAGETDLTKRIDLNSYDETQDLANNINEVFQRLFNLANQVQSAAFHVGAASAEISAASKQMLGGLSDQRIKIESSSTAVTELSASIQQVASHASAATKAAEKSSTAINAARTRMKQIRDSVDDSGQKILELGESSKRIGNIVEVIRQISEQTSLLALNASIEAAHAGEHGRGFAVVADEVSSLARRVGQSAKDIETLIQTIKEQTSQAIYSMEHGRGEVEGGTEIVEHTLADLGQLITVVNETASAVQEQAVVSDEIARNMDAVRSIAGELLGGSEESVTQADTLHELAFQLEQSVGGFNLDASGGSNPKLLSTPSLEKRALHPRGPLDD